MKCQVMNIQIPLGDLPFPKMHTFAMIGIGLGQAQAQYLRGDSWPISLLLKRLAPESRYAARYWSKTNRHGPLSVLVLEGDGWKIDADLLTPHPHRRLVIVDRGVRIDSPDGYIIGSQKCLLHIFNKFSALAENLTSPQ